MPPLETMDRRQKALYWEKTGDTRNATPKLAAAEEVDVRWSWNRNVVPDATGLNVAVDARVVLDFDPPPGSVLWQGALADCPTVDGDPVPAGDLYEVVTTAKTPDLKNRFVRYEATVRRYSDSLPEDVG
jgi:hypothetical protein